MLFNLISLSNEYNLKMMPYWDENYSKNYKKDNNVDRNPSFKYNILKNIKFYDKFDNDFIKYQEEEWKYNNIVLNKNTDYNISGYFQSYKYFWNNIKLIKNILNIDNKLINKIKKYYSSFNKDIIAIHIRQGDYLNKQDYHPVQSLEYYKKALSYFDLEKHTILLFSDDYKNSCKFLEPLNLNYVDARDFSHNDEVQFYMLMLCNKKICANSSFSLMSCYLNEMFLFCENSEYIFPNKWFGIKGPEFNMDDLMLNYKFSTIDCYNFKIQSKFNVVSTLHIKDKNRYIKYLKYNKKYLTQYNKFYYIANENYNINNSNFIDENKYPFSKLDVINYLKEYIPDYRWGWYYQQLLKFYIFKINNLEFDNVLIFDSDILLLKNIHFFKNDKPILYKRNTGNGKMHIPYGKSINYILPDLSIDESDSGICHMMLFNKKILDHLFIKVEEYHKKDFWKVCLDSVIHYVKEYGFNISILSEYELYYNFIKMYYKDSYIIKYNLLYKDISFDKFLKNGINNSKLSFIADHHYQSREEENHKIDNLMNTYDEKLIKLIIKKYNKLKNKVHLNNNFEYHYKKTLFKKLFKYTTFDCFKNRLIKYFSENEINTIINLECKKKVIKFRKTIDNLIINYLKNKKQEKNNLINDIIVNNINLESDKFYFGIIIPVFNRYYVTKIFLECLKKNVNFDSVVFCIVDDGSNNNVLEELNDLKNSNIKCVIVQCKRQIDNIFGTDNTNIPGSLYPFTLYIGHEIIKNNCKILGVLDSDAIITPDYFKICKSFTKNLDMNNVIFSAFNSCSDCHKISGKDKINDTEILYKNMVGGISQFYSVELYNKFKYKFTGEESPNYWACDYDFQISNYMMKNNKKYVCLKNSIVQHIGIKSTMIRVGVEHNHNDSDIVDVIYNLLISPDTKKNINIEFDFDDTLRFDKDNIDSIFKNNILDKYMKRKNKFYFIDKIFYINLDERKDRKEIIEKQFKKFDISNYERFSAIKPKFNKKYNTNFINQQIKKYLNNDKIVNDLFENYDSKYILDFDKNYIKSKNLENQKKYILGALGCKMSFIEIFKICNQKYENILIIEDDALFHNNFNKHIELLNKNMNNLNFNYDMIWLSPNWLYKNDDNLLNRCYSYKFINNNLGLINSSKSIDNKVGSTLNNGGNIFSKKCIEYILNNFEKSKQNEIDMWFREYIQSKNSVYTTIPNLIQQRVEESSIEGFKVNYDKDIHYKTRMKFNIFSLVEEKDKELYLENLKNNLQKMIGYEKIYYISNKKLFNNEILHFIDNKNLESNIDKLKNNFKNKVNDNEIKYFYYMDINTKFENNYLPFDENNNLVLKNNFY